MHFVSSHCNTQNCRICKKPATHKVGEEIPRDDPFPNTLRHNFTAYICCEHFRMIMGSAVFCPNQIQKISTVSVELKSEIGTSREPAKVLIYENSQLITEVVAKLDLKQGADSGWYHCVTLEKQ